jgi:hypothetical protein
MRRTLLSTKLVEVGLDRPAAVIVLDGVRVVAQRDETMSLIVDTRVRSIREVLDVVLDTCAVADISVVDPPLEDVIAQIYETASTCPRGSWRSLVNDFEVSDAALLGLAAIVFAAWPP